MAPNERENYNLAAFLQPEEDLITAPAPEAEQPFSLKLRPYSAGSDLALREVRNELLFPRSKRPVQDLETGETVEVAEPENLERAIYEFAWIHSAPLDEVIRALPVNAGSRLLFDEAVARFAFDIPPSAIPRICEQVQRIVQAATPAKVTTKPKPGDSALGRTEGEPPPN